MKSGWDDHDAGAFGDGLGVCVYGSRLIGADPALVLHGGGNTSVKAPWLDITGEHVDSLWVKGSGWDLASIEPAGFAPLPLDRLRRLLAVGALTDAAMMAALSAARLDPTAPQPSVEALLHAALPHHAVLHSHADAIVSVTNLADGARRARDVFGDDVLVVPYVMPGFKLAKAVAARWEADGDERRHRGIVLVHHGLFTFGSTVREAYDHHIELITRAERWADGQGRSARSAALPLSLPAADPVVLAELRQRISAAAGTPMIVRRHADPAIAAFVTRADGASLATRGPLTPDHVIRTKRVPMIGTDVDAYVAGYQRYVDAHRHRVDGPLAPVDPAPRVVLDRTLGLLTVGRTAADAAVAADIYRHTMAVLERAEDDLGGYRALDAADVFDVEYWDLEQAKLRSQAAPPPFAGQVALVTGAASGIGRASAAALLAGGCAVVGLDVADGVDRTLGSESWFGVQADVTDGDAVRDAVGAGVERFGGLDLVVVSAGVFGESRPVAELDASEWRRVMDVNVDAVAALLPIVHPLLSRSPASPAVVIVGSKNVRAPGRSAAAYSASKAALTQLARVTALEWAADGVRVNLVHPDAVFDTGLWTDDLVARRARAYGLSAEEYKRRNLLGVEITAADVAKVVVALCSGAFSKTTGAQVPIDGGSDRVI